MADDTPEEIEDFPPDTTDSSASETLADANSNEEERSESSPATVVPQPPVTEPVDVRDLDWTRIAASIDPSASRERMRDTVEKFESMLDSHGDAAMLFDSFRETPADHAVKVEEVSEEPLWFIGDLHGDILTLEAALSLIQREGESAGTASSRIVLLGDLFDDGGYGLEVLLRVYELILERPRDTCFIAGNHDEALHYDGARFTATVSPSDFMDFLNANLVHEWIERAGKLAVRLSERAPRALFFPDGLLVAHGGFPLADLHERLEDTGDWNDPQCLSDFVWTRAHPRARRKLPNRSSRGSQFGYEDFAQFCGLSERLGRPVTHMIRGHDHVDERFEIPEAYAATPVLTTVALSRRLDRELFGPHVRVPTVARWVRGALPQVYRLHIPDTVVREFYPEIEAEPVAEAVSEGAHE